MRVSFDLVSGLVFGKLWGLQFRVQIFSCRACTSQRVHVPNDLVLGIWVVLVVIQVLVKYMIIRYLHPEDLFVSKLRSLNVPSSSFGLAACAKKVAVVA